jgi:hypothetical protein
MDTRAYQILQRIKQPSVAWNTELVKDNSGTNTPPAGQAPNTPGIPSEGPSLGALNSMLQQPEATEMDPSRPLEESFGTQSPASKPSGDMSKLDAILKARGTAKRNFLGG